MTHGLDIVYFSSIDWDYTWQRPQQLASRLAAHGHLLFVNPLGLRQVTLKDWKRVLRRVVFRLASRGPRPPYSTLSVFAPLFYQPVPHGPGANSLNGWLLSRGIRSWAERCHVHSPVYWVGVPSQAVWQALRRCEPGTLVFDCIDDFAYFHGQDPKIRATEELFATNARWVVATGERLYERMQQLNPNTVCIPNAADYDHFAAPVPPGASGELAQLPHPVIGYVGEVASWFDFDLLYQLAAQNPQWHIVLIGQVQTVIPARVLGMTNIHILGRKLYQELPGLMSSFDACILPFQLNPLTMATNPVKLYEYLAAGKPVISTPIQECVRLGDLVQIAAAADFPAAVRAVLATETEAKKEQRRRFAAANTWDVRVAEIVRLLRPVPQ